MSQLKQLLYSDLARQYELEGRTDTRPTFPGLLKRLLHFRFLPIVLLRTSRAAMLAGIPGLPKLLTYANLVLFGLEVTPKCEIGPGLFLPHPVGCIIGAARLGRNVSVLHGVVVGALQFDMEFRPELRPEIGDNVLLGTGCKVLGSMRIGDNAIIGANSLVLDSVEPNTTVVGSPARAVSSLAKS